MSDTQIKAFSELKRMLLIINPVSGRRTSLRFLPDIIRSFTESGYNVSVFPTGAKGDATEIARLYAPHYDRIVCIGGDGTLNETVTGRILSGEKTPIGYIPSGSTNDFAACHGISSDMLTAAAGIAYGCEHKIDVGKFGDKYFTYVAAFGMFSWLSYTTPQNLKNVLGHSAYILDAVKDLPKIKAQHLKISTESFTCEGDYIFGAICNSTSVAGTFTLPRELVDTGDGRFEVLLVHEPATIIDFQNIVLGVLTQDYSSPFLELFQASSLTIEAPPELEWSLDGERGEGAAVIKVENLEKELTVIS